MRRKCQPSCRRVVIRCLMMCLLIAGVPSTSKAGPIKDKLGQGIDKLASSMKKLKSKVEPLKPKGKLKKAFKGKLERKSSLKHQQACSNGCPGGVRHRYK